MSLTHLALSLNKDFGQNENFTDYNTAANECINLFDGVYAYGCPGKFSRCSTNRYGATGGLGAISFRIHRQYYTKKRVLQDLQNVMRLKLDWTVRLNR